MNRKEAHVPIQTVIDAFRYAFHREYNEAIMNGKKMLASNVEEYMVNVLEHEFIVEESIGPVGNIIIDLETR